MESATSPHVRLAARPNGTAKQMQNFSHFLIQTPPTKPELLANLPYPLQHLYKGDYRLAAAGHSNGRVVTTTRTKDKYRQAWIEYCKPLGVDPTLEPETTSFQTKINTIMGFIGRVKSGWYGHGRQVENGTVTTALTAVGQALSVNDRCNLLKPQ